jgi:hypothetical protein
MSIRIQRHFATNFQKRKTNCFRTKQTFSRKTNFFAQNKLFRVENRPKQTLFAQKNRAKQTFFAPKNRANNFFRTKKSLKTNFFRTKKSPKTNFFAYKIAQTNFFPAENRRSGTNLIPKRNQILDRGSFSPTPVA